MGCQGRGGAEGVHPSGCPPFPPWSPSFAMAFNEEVRFSDHRGAADPGIQYEQPAIEECAMAVSRTTL